MGGKYENKELIETLWNVNLIIIDSVPSMQPELIETLWNVNYGRSYTSQGVIIELIETLWNVNVVAFLYA